MMALIDLLQCTHAPCSHLKNVHVWGCSCYILEPALKDGHKLPKWKLHSHHATFVGFSPCHSLVVPHVLNTHSGKISPQLHIVFDDWFTSILSMGANDAFDPSQWPEFFTTSHFQFYFDDDGPIPLGSEWSMDESDHQHNKECTDHLNPGHLHQREPTPLSLGPPSLVPSCSLHSTIL